MVLMGTTSCITRVFECNSSNGMSTFFLFHNGSLYMVKTVHGLWTSFSFHVKYANYLAGKKNPITVNAMKHETQCMSQTVCDMLVNAQMK